MKTALVIGATGLVGSCLTDLLLADRRFGLVKVFVRRSTSKVHAKLSEHIIDFDNPESWSKSVTGDVLFSALGTTLRQAGSKEAQYKIDYNYQYEFAKAAAENGVSTYVLVSSAGASPESRIFYSRMKGTLERDIAKLNFQHISIIQPGLLAGERQQPRMGEKIGYYVLSVLKYIPGLKGYRPVQASVVARAMINASFYTKDSLQVYALQKVFDMANKKLEA